MKSKWLTITLAMLGPFAPHISHAFGDSCGPIFSSQYALQGRIEVRPSALKGPAATDFADTLLKVESLLGPLLPAPEARITIDNVFSLSAFNAGDFTISVGLRPNRMGSKNPTINQRTLMHEYSHAIFEKNLMKDLESYKHFRKEFIELINKEDQLHMEATEIGQRAKETTDPIEKARLKQLETEKMAEAEFAFLRKKELMPYWNLRSALHELFADTLTVTATRNPKAMHEILRDAEETYKKHSSQEIYLRNFTDGRHHLNRQIWQKEHPFFGSYAADPYYALLPARWELWKISKNKIKSDNYQKTLIPKVFSILERNLSEILAKRPEEIGSRGFKDIEKLNAQIIEDFRNEL